MGPPVSGAIQKSALDVKRGVDGPVNMWDKRSSTRRDEMTKTTAHYKGRKIVETFATWQEARDRANWHWSNGADVAEWGK
jgi:hypothetical protein